MAGELTLNTSLRAIVNGSVTELGSVNESADIKATERAHKTFQEIGIVEEVVDLGDVAPPAIFQVKNIGADPVEFQVSGGAALLSLPAGKSQHLYIKSGVVLAAIAIGSPSKIEYMAAPIV